MEVRLAPGARHTRSAALRLPAPAGVLLSRSATHRRGPRGGSFDPVHLAHVSVARHALQHLKLDTVTLIRAAQPWQREALGADPAQRLDMLKIATADEPGL